MIDALGQYFIPTLAFAILLLLTWIDILVLKDVTGTPRIKWMLISIIPFFGSLVYAISVKRKFVMVSFVMVAVSLIAFYSIKYYVTHKPQRDVTKEAGIQVTAQQIFDEFTANESAANLKYGNKAIQVTGEVAEVKKNQDNYTVVILKTTDPVFGVNCTFKEDPGQVQPGNTITFKGICTAFLSDVVINEGVRINK